MVACDIRCDVTPGCMGWAEGPENRGAGFQVRICDLTPASMSRAEGEKYCVVSFQDVKLLCHTRLHEVGGGGEVSWRVISKGKF